MTAVGRRERGARPTCTRAVNTSLPARGGTKATAWVGAARAAAVPNRAKESHERHAGASEHEGIFPPTCCTSSKPGGSTLRLHAGTPTPPWRRAGRRYDPHNYTTKTTLTITHRTRVLLRLGGRCGQWGGPAKRLGDPLHIRIRRFHPAEDALGHPTDAHHQQVGGVPPQATATRSTPSAQTSTPMGTSGGGSKIKARGPNGGTTRSQWELASENSDLELSSNARLERFLTSKIVSAA